MAKILYKKCIDKLKEALGENHPDTVRAVEHLADLYALHGEDGNGNSNGNNDNDDGRLYRYSGSSDKKDSDKADDDNADI